MAKMMKSMMKKMVIGHYENLNEYFLLRFWNFNQNRFNFFSHLHSYQLTWILTDQASAMKMKKTMKAMKMKKSMAMRKKAMKKSVIAKGEYSSDLVW